MPPSKLSPAAMVCTASRAEVPEEAGMLPPEDPPGAKVAEAVVDGTVLELVLLLKPLAMAMTLLMVLELSLSSSAGATSYFVSQEESLAATKCLRWLRALAPRARARRAS
jgi:hypothetical protein